MESAFAAALLHGIVHSLGAEVFQARTLQKFLQPKDVGVLYGSSFDRPPLFLQQHRGALHFIVGKRVHQRWVVAKRDKHVGKN
jgi:hypothetical protein